MVSKTKLRILQNARILFNEEGQSNVAMVDIAAVLDISPGNLYYHYRGKEQLIPVLFEGFDAELDALLSASIEALGSLQDRWAYCYLLLEVLNKYRFIFGLDIIRYDKSLARRYARLRSLLNKRIEALIVQLQSTREGGDGGDGKLLTVIDNRMLAENGDDFKHGDEYIAQRGYKVDETGTVRY